MATRALIGYLDTDGDTKLTTTYNHYDGYPQNLGKGLNDFYSSDAKAEEIANVGYISFLDGETGEWDAKNKSTADVVQLPDNFNEAMMTIAEEIDKIGADYGYIWDNENEEWITVKNNGIGRMVEDLEMNLAHLKGKFGMMPERPSHYVDNDEADEDARLYRMNKENKNKIKEGTWSVLPARIPEFIKAMENIKEEFHSVVGDDTVFNHLDAAIEAAQDLMSMGSAPEIPGFEGTKAALDNLFEEQFVRQMKYRAGIIK
jgi:hypothetical protein